MFLEIRAVGWHLGRDRRDTFPSAMCRSYHPTTFSRLVTRPSVRDRSGDFCHQMKTELGATVVDSRVAAGGPVEEHGLAGRALISLVAYASDHLAVPERMDLHEEAEDTLGVCPALAQFRNKSLGNQLLLGVGVPVLSMKGAVARNGRPAGEDDNHSQQEAPQV